MIQLLRPDLHVAVSCPDDWTMIELDDGTGLRVSHPADPRVALQITSDEYNTPLDEAVERARNSIPADVPCGILALQRAAVCPDGTLKSCGPLAALVFSARDRSFLYRIIVAAGAGRRWTIRLETLQRKEWWQESTLLETMLKSLLLL
jgi:hypothetical protein